MSDSRPPLTKRQQKVYDFIKSHIEDKGWPPTVRETMEHMGIKSPNGVMCHFKALKKKEVIEFGEAQMSRCLRLAGYRLKHVKVKD